MDNDQERNQRANQENQLNTPNLAEIIRLALGDKLQGREDIDINAAAGELADLLSQSGAREQQRVIQEQLREASGRRRGAEAAPAGWLGEAISQGMNKPQLGSRLLPQFEALLSAYGRLPQESFGTIVAQDIFTALRNLRVQAEELGEEAAIPQLDQAINNFNSIVGAGMRNLQGRELGSVGFTLTQEEIDTMRSSLRGARQVFESWVSRIESVDRFAFEDVNANLFQKFQTAISWFPTLDYAQEGDRKTQQRKIEEIIKEYRSRVDLHNMKQALASNNEEAIQNQANHMGSASIFEGFRVRKAKTAFNLFQRYFERYRFRYGTATHMYDDEERKHKSVEEGKRITGTALDRITPEAVAQIRREVDIELKDNPKLYGYDTPEEALTAARVGFNLFRASMRLAVHVSKGRVIRVNMDAPQGYRQLWLEPPFQSDPDELLVNAYNPWQFGIEKWTKFGPPQYKILENIFILLGKGDRDIGEQEFLNLLNIADFFSSGWRIDNIFNVMEDRMKYYKRIELGRKLEKNEVDEINDRRKRLATGFRLQKAMTGDNEEEKQAAIKTSAIYRPLELVKAYAVTIDEKGRKYRTGEQHDEFQKMLGNGDFNVNGLVIDNYVKLEEVLGRYIYPIYEHAMRDDISWNKLDGIDIGGAQTGSEHFGFIEEVVNKVNAKLRPDDRNRLEIGQLQSIYKKLQNFLLDDKSVHDLRTNKKHSHMWHKTLYLDDAPLGRLEDVIDDPVNDTFIPAISKKLFEVEGGRRDPYGRMWGDTGSAVGANAHLFNAMQARDPDTLLKELAGVSSQLVGYAGRKPYFKLALNVGAGWLDMAKADFSWGAIGLANKVPWATSEFERLFGLAAPAMTREQLRGTYEKVKLMFGDFAKEGKEAKDLDDRIKKELGVEGWKVSTSVLKLIALASLLIFLKEAFEEIKEEA